MRRFINKNRFKIDAFIQKILIIFLYYFHENTSYFDCNDIGNEDDVSQQGVNVNETNIQQTEL